MSRPNPVQVLGTCGLLASVLAALSGYLDIPSLLGASGTVMTAGNIYAILAKPKT